MSEIKPISFNLSKLFKSKGFDEPCLGYYENQDENLVINFNNLPLTEEQEKRPSLYTIDNRNSNLPQWATAAPLCEQVVEWLRLNHNIWLIVVPSELYKGKWYYHRFHLLDSNKDSEPELVGRI